MKWAQAIVEIVESFNRIGRPGYAVVAVGLMLSALVLVAFAIAMGSAHTVTSLRALFG